MWGYPRLRGRKPPRMSSSVASSESHALQHLETTLIKEIEKDFFEANVSFRPLKHGETIPAQTSTPTFRSSHKHATAHHRHPVISVLSSEVCPPRTEGSEGPAWLVVRTLTGKTLPLPTVGPSDTVGDVVRLLRTEYEVSGGTLFLNEDYTYVRENPKYFLACVKPSLVYHRSTRNSKQQTRLIEKQNTT